MAANHLRLLSNVGRNLQKKCTINSSFAAFSTASTVRKNDTSGDSVTHTGQHWEADDYRLVRFESSPKQINSQFAIDLIAKVPPKEAKSRVVSCDGGGGALGHPKVYINLDQPGNHSCGYCGLRFFKNDDHH